MRVFYISRRHHLDWSRIVHDNDYSFTTGRWLNGRLFGHYVSVFVPYFWQVKP